MAGTLTLALLSVLATGKLFLKNDKIKMIKKLEFP